MPNWSSEPPKEKDGFALRILRTPQAKAIKAIITSTDVLGCCTHFVRNRTLPCEGQETCPWCAEGLSWRWHGYVAALLVDSLEHFLFEFTANASDTFRNYQKLHDNLRGCYFQATRPSQRHNGRVVIQARPADQHRVHLPDPPDIKKLLCHLWNIPNTQVQDHYTPDRVGRMVHLEKPNGRKPAAAKK